MRKEIIYLNSQELDSILAQHSKGVTESKVESHSNTTSRSMHSSHSGSVQAKLGLKLSNVGGSISSSKAAGLIQDELFGENNNVVLNDYKLDLFLDNENINTKSFETADEGDLLLYKNSFQLSDFKLASSMIAGKTSNKINPTIKYFLKESGNFDNDTQKGMQQINYYFQLLNSLLGNNLLLKMPGLISFTDITSFRINSGERQLISLTNRQLNILGIVETINKKDETDLNKDLASLAKNEDLSKLSAVIPYLTEIILSASGLLSKNDKFVRPIALFFD